jgi:hypothetical protein
MTQQADDFECCPPFDPTPWDNKQFEWEKRHFIKDKVCTLFYLPLNFGAVIKRLMKKTESVNVRMEDWLCLSDHTSKWNMDIYIAVDKEVPGVENVEFSGSFYSRVYEGSFKNTGEWCKDYMKNVSACGLEVEKMYMWYTTCPKCAKKYGKNYVVILSKVGQNSR